MSDHYTDQFGQTIARRVSEPEMTNYRNVDDLDHDEQVRSWALDAASRVCQSYLEPDSYMTHESSERIVGIAKRFEQYLRDGS